LQICDLDQNMALTIWTLMMLMTTARSRCFALKLSQWEYPDPVLTDQEATCGCFNEHSAKGPKFNGEQAPTGNLACQQTVSTVSMTQLSGI